MGMKDNDYLYGGNNNDYVDGGGGDDHIYGDAGNDKLKGWTGNDTLYGGQGADTVVLSDGWGHDTMMDFENGTDKIDMRSVSNLTTYNQLYIEQVGNNVDIHYGADVLTLENTYSWLIDSSDFFL